MKDVFKNHKVGDKVWNLQTKKWETIEKIIKDSRYPIHTRYSTYKKDGRASENAMIATIFPSKFKLVIPDEAYQMPLPNLAVDTKVVVWNNIDGIRHKRYFAKFNNAGNIVCFPCGATSFTAGLGKREHWRYYKVYKEKENEQ